MAGNSGAADVVVVGGGAIGCAIAWELTRRGAAVTVVERGTPGRGATWAAGGMLSPLPESRETGAFLTLALASLDRFPALAGAIREATGIDVQHRDDGKLLVAFDGAEAEALAEAYRWQRAAGFDVEWLEDGAAVRSLEPALSAAAVAGMYVVRDHQVDNRRLGRALWLAAAGAGVRFRLGDPVAAIRVGGGVVNGVELVGGERLDAGAVVIAAGSWSARIGGLPRPLPIFPVRGQMVAVETVPPALRRVVRTRRCYLIPRSDGRLIVGATAERAGFRTRPTAAGIRSLLSAALEVLPDLGEAPIVETWAGLRPGTPDELPILGPDPEVKGLYYATGHYRNGILLAPITATLLAEAILGEPATLPLEPFAVDRFAVTAAG